MTADYVLDLSDNLEDLEQDMSNWMQLPYDMRKRSNDACIMKYGCTNEQLYNMIKARLMNIDMNEYDPENKISMEQALIHEKALLSESSKEEKPIVEFDELGYRLMENEWLHDHDMKIYDLTEDTLTDDFELDSLNEADLFPGSAKPIYIVLSYTSTIVGRLITSVKKCTYSHACISMDHKLHNMYSFNLRTNKGVNGISVEDIKDYPQGPNSKLLVMAIFVTDDVKKKIESNLKWFTDNKNKTKYDISDFVYILFNKKKETGTNNNFGMVCSQFVDYTLKMANINITDKPSNLVTPEDFNTIRSKNQDMYAVYEGPLNQYNEKKTYFKVYRLSQKINTTNKFTVGMNNIISKITESMVLDEVGVKVIDKDGDYHYATNKKHLKGYTSDGQINVNLKKIQMGDKVHEMDDDLVVINDFISDDRPDYSMGELEDLYNIYVTATMDHKKRSDAYSIQIWGAPVPTMYQRMKEKLKAFADNEEIEKSVDDGNFKFTPSKTDQELIAYKESITETAQDNLESMIRKLDCIIPSKERSLYEQYVLESFGQTIKVNGHSYRQDMPGVTPFLTYTEYLHNPRVHDERKLMNIDPFTYVFNYKDSKTSLQHYYDNNEVDKIEDARWNKYIRPDEKSIEYAKEKQAKWMDEHYSFDIYNIENFTSRLEPTSTINESMDIVENGKRLVPVYIIMGFNKKYSVVDFFGKTHKYKIPNYNHVGISSTPNFTTVYTFSHKMNSNIADRLEKENFNHDYDKYQTIQVITFFVSSDVKKRIMDSLENYLKAQDNTAGDFDTIMNIVTNPPKVVHKDPHVLFGYFIDSIFRIADIYDQTGSYFDKHKTSENAKLYIMYTGEVRRYKPGKVMKAIEELKKNENFKDYNFLPGSITDHQFDYYDFETYRIKFENTNVQNIINEIREYLTPVAFFEETLPYQSYDEYLNRYNEIITILNQYNDNDEEGIKRALSDLRDLISLLEKEIKKMQKDHPEYERFTILLSDAKMNCEEYTKVVKKLDSDYSDHNSLKESVDHTIYKYSFRRTE